MELLCSENHLHLFLPCTDAYIIQRPGRILASSHQENIGSGVTQYNYEFALTHSTTLFNLVVRIFLA